MKLTIYYEESDLIHVRLAIRAHDPANHVFTILAEQLTGVTSHDMTGTETVTLPALFQDNESLVILARNELGAIVASAVLEVDLTCLPDGYVLHPCSAHNALIDQCETTRMDATTTSGLVAVAPVTDEWLDASVLLDTVHALLAKERMA